MMTPVCKAIFFSKFKIVECIVALVEIDRTGRGGRAEQGGGRRQVAERRGGGIR